MLNETWKCPDCGTENEAENNFCGECGAKKPEREIGTSAGRVVSNQINPASNSRTVPDQSSCDESDDVDDMPEDKLTTGNLILSILWPLGGVILGIYFFAKGRPKSGRTCLIIGIIGMILLILLGIL